MSDKKRVRNNRFNVEWSYARECWSFLSKGWDVPSIPKYTLWETDEGKPEKIIGYKPITPMKVTCKGVTVFEGINT